ncbi:hypothetical protein [Streptomyces sp. ISL-98]|uniref:hypothetical protein n=1 Tax=Streptomyces sp. ISL-98 TaxID=2819192 RepID=UPI0020356830|nr:hypothetical protein [Streptomyces sp. ISL-98]
MTMPLAKVWTRGDALHRSEQHLLGLFGGLLLGGQAEGAGRFGQDGGAMLDDSKLAHLLAEPPFDHLNSPLIYERRAERFQGVVDC